MSLDKDQIHEFRKAIWNYAKSSSRVFPWRNTNNPYFILVSEIMLQQTQTSRVEDKYKSFIKTFPTVKRLAIAPQSQVLTLWSGLGYNRRALFLHRTAQMIVKDFNGKVPENIEDLKLLPGLGYATAAAIAVAAYKQPLAYMETNIRTVYLNYFFPEQSNVADRELLPLIEQTLVKGEKVRDWYNALMDYGVMLKKTMVNPSRNSKHHQKQAAFTGSNRQLRGQILKLLLTNNTLSENQLLKQLNFPESKVKTALLNLEKEEFIIKFSKGWSLSQK